MLRSAVSKVMWVGRATVFLVGLSVILAFLFGVAATALAGTGVGATFNLGKANTVNKISSLIGSASSAMLKIDNNGAGPALALQVEPGKQPLTVDSTRKVARLNADRVDGRDAPLWAVINADGTKARGAGVVSSTNNVHLGSSAGNYTVTFDRNVSGCAYIASVGGTQTGFKGQVTVFGHGGNPNAVNVVTSDSAGNQEPALPFHLAVLC